MSRILTTGRVPHLNTLRNRIALFVLGLGCRHPEGIVCEHRHFEYDNWLAGYHKGFAAATEHARDTDTGARRPRFDMDQDDSQEPPWTDTGGTGR